MFRLSQNANDIETRTKMEKAFTNKSSTKLKHWKNKWRKNQRKNVPFWILNPWQVSIFLGNRSFFSAFGAYMKISDIFLRNEQN